MTAILLPAYNESPAVLADTLQQWAAPNHYFILVDDGSALPVELSPDLNGEVVRHPTNRGQGAALRTGIARAVELNLPYALTVDADGQHPPENAPALLEPLRTDRADVTFGSRFLRGTDAQRIPLGRRWVLQLATTFQRYVTGLPLTDAHNGLRGLNRAAMQQLIITEDRMAHASEIPLRVRLLGLRWEEVPVSIRYTDYANRKGQSLWRAFPLSWRIWRMKKRLH